ncbi:hypothetical protein ACFYNO_28480 [Kitasatospora sp. NPDC006697]|uniref:hypothetical protein n=1 Tax=Kitasatospora sp. NPDC006697 TaxID=3364020 RepID=UPI003691F66C
MTGTWDPHGSLRRMLWIGGAQWAGKTTVSELIAHRYGLTAYHYDYHDARGHEDRRIARRVALGEPAAGPTPEQRWLSGTPEELAAETLAGFPARFAWVLDDLRALTTGRPALAEGWGLRPELVLPLVDSPRRMVVLVPTEEFRRARLRALPRAGAVHGPVSDPALAQRNRLERDRLVGRDAVLRARELGVRVIEVDGSADAEGVAGMVAEHFGEYL